MIFYVGLHQPSDARHFARSCISITRLAKRKKPVQGRLLLDSGAFMELHLFGGYRHSPAEYAAKVRRLIDNRIADIEIAVAQDFMCEPFMLARTGLTVAEHQRLTIERYDALLAECLPVPIMPVLQGYRPADYVRHLAMYGNRLTQSMWVGIGSVCKRNGAPEQIVDVLDAVDRERPDLRRHGFGVKETALLHPGVRALLYSADSMAWSFAARRQKRNSNDWREAQAFVERIDKTLSIGPRPWQPRLFHDTV